MAIDFIKKLLLSHISPFFLAVPDLISSSPVISKPNLEILLTVIVFIPQLANLLKIPGVIFTPFLINISPLNTWSFFSLIQELLDDFSFIRIYSFPFKSSKETCSWGITQKQLSGTNEPVLILTASPFLRRSLNGFPGKDSPTIFHLFPFVVDSPKAYPSITDDL